MGASEHRFRSIFRNTPRRNALLQLSLGALVILASVWLIANTTANLQRRGIAVGYDFLTRAARFPISESLLPYAPTDTFAWALLVGWVNTLFISATVGVFATLFGTALALGRRAKQPLLRAFATSAVELARNTPLVVQLLFWYALVTVTFPGVQAALNPLPGTYVANRGIFVPTLRVVGGSTISFAIIFAGIIGLVTAAALGRRARLRSDPAHHWGWLASGIVFALALLLWRLQGLHWQLSAPRLERFNFAGGLRLTPEIASLLLGLTLYTAAFVGETIRGGLEAVNQGQWEAARSIGLSEAQTLRLIILPQALRLIIPPMISQYVNLIKNTTLALIVGYPEMAFVTATAINQTGQAVEGAMILVCAYLTISTSASILMNWYNARAARAWHT